MLENEFNIATSKLEKKLKFIRENSGLRKFDPTIPAEIEINEFYLDNETVNRVMVVLRASGCSAYKEHSGCSMCGHLDGAMSGKVSKEDYLSQWSKVLSGETIENKDIQFDINNYPIVCLYNLGSLLNPEEVNPEAVKEIFESIEKNKGVQKVIIESRPEFVTSQNLENIAKAFSGIVEIGIGLESSNYEIRELCHHKKMPSLDIYEQAVELIKKFGMRSLAYVNQKPPFLTEKEAIDDVVRTSKYALSIGTDAISIEPTSLQKNTLTDYLAQKDTYRVPWLWSVKEATEKIIESINFTPDLRIGGYFDEEILSGSQGTAPGVERNELFPYSTSGNCTLCTPNFIEQIKQYNKTNNVSVLKAIPKCPNCYSEWEEAKKEEDSRNIARRIIEEL